jgi:hypothetical protein
VEGPLVAPTTAAAAVCAAAVCAAARERVDARAARLERCLAGAAAVAAGEAVERITFAPGRRTRHRPAVRRGWLLDTTTTSLRPLRLLACVVHLLRGCVGVHLFCARRATSATSATVVQTSVCERVTRASRALARDDFRSLSALCHFGNRYCKHEETGCAHVICAHALVWAA